MPAEDDHSQHARTGAITVKNSPITVSLMNRKTPTERFAYLYHSSTKQSDAAWGRFEIQMSNHGTTPIAITQASRLEVLIPKDLLTARDLEEVRLEDGSEQVWSCTASAKSLMFRLKQSRLEIAPSGTMTILLGNLLASEAPALHRQVKFVWEQFEGIEDDGRSYDVYRELIKENEPAQIWCDWGPRAEYYRQPAECVYFTPRPTTTTYEGIKNRLILRISNQGKALEGEHAVFTVTFPTEEYGDAKTALCTTEQLDKAGCRRFETNAWQNPEVEKQGQTKQWILRPPAGSKVVLGEAATVQFEFYDVVTELRDGTAYAQVHWTGIDGRNPGYRTLAITKVPPVPFVKSMVALYEGKPLASGEGVYFREAYSVKWESFAADQCVLAETGERLGANFTKSWVAEQLVQKFTITPEISLPAANFIRTGDPVSIEVPLLEAVMNVQQEAAVDSMNRARLRWQSRGGTVFLTAPSRAHVEMKATDMLLVDNSGLYAFACEGLRPKTTPVVVNVPHVTMTYDAVWSADGNKVVVSWSAQNSSWVEIWADYPGRVVKQTVAAQGSFELDGGGMTRCSIRASGNGECMWVWYHPSRGSKIPKLSGTEIKLPSGPDHQFAWKAEEVKGCILVVFTADDEDAGMEAKTQGEIAKNFKNGVRGYMMFTESLADNMFIMAYAPAGMGLPRGVSERADEMKMLAAKFMKGHAGDVA